jgi:hypothetical protein
VNTEQTTPVPIGTRIRDTFLAPSRLADDLESSGGPWLDVLLISTAIAVIAVLSVPDEVFLDPMRSAVSRRGEPVEITSAPAVVVQWGRAMGMLATLATHPMIAFVLAGLLTAVFSIIGRGKGTYVDYLSLSSHALLIPALGTVFALLVRLATGTFGGADPFGTLVSPDAAGSFLAAALISVDPFVVWMLFVMGVATSRIDGRRTTGRASLVLISGYLLSLLVTTALLHRELL